MTRKLILLASVSLIFVQASIAQTLTNKRLIEVSDSLIGKWKLVEINRFINSDTIKQKPSVAPLGISTSRPPTEIYFDSLSTFKISQYCMKCPFIEWNGKYDVGYIALDNKNYLYLTFIEQRDKYLKKKQPSFTKEFNGRLHSIKANQFQLIDEKGFLLIYERF